MSLHKCENCGGALLTGSDGMAAGCTYCKVGVHGGIDADALAASLGRDLTDIQKFVEHLATTLESAFGTLVEVERGGLFTSHVKSVQVTLEPSVFRLEVHGHHLVAKKTKVVRGVALKNETLQVPAFLQELSAALSRAAQENQEARAALQKSLR